MSRRGQPLSKRTKDSYFYLLRDHINPTFETTPVTDITLDMVRDWYGSVSRAKKPAKRPRTETPPSKDVPTARARAYEVLRMVLNVACEDGLIDKNPCRIKGATAIQPNHDATVLQPQEIAALANAMPKQLRVSILIAAWCGLRPSETFELRRKSFKADCAIVTISHAATYRAGEITIDRPKSGSTGDVVVPEHIRAAIRTHLMTTSGNPRMPYSSPIPNAAAPCANGSTAAFSTPPASRSTEKASAPANFATPAAPSPPKPEAPSPKSWNAFATRHPKPPCATRKSRPDAHKP